MDEIKKYKLNLKTIIADSKKQRRSIKVLKKAKELKKQSDTSIEDQRIKDKWNKVSRKRGISFTKYINEYYKEYEHIEFADYLEDENRHSEWYQIKLDFEHGFVIFNNYKKKKEKKYTYISEKGLTNILNYTKEYLEEFEHEFYLNIAIIKELTETDIKVELKATKEQQEINKKKRIEKKIRFEEERKELQELIERGYSEDNEGLQNYNNKIKKQQESLKKIDEMVMVSNKELRETKVIEKNDIKELVTLEKSEELEEQTDIVFTLEERKLHTLTKYTFCKELVNVDNDIKNHVYMELNTLNRKDNYASLEGELPIIQPVKEEEDSKGIEEIPDIPDKGAPILSDVLMDKMHGKNLNVQRIIMLHNLKDNEAQGENEEFKYQQKYIRDFIKSGIFFRYNKKDELNFKLEILAYNNSKLRNNLMYRVNPQFNDFCFYKRKEPEILALFKKISKVIKERKEGEQQYKSRISELNFQIIREYFKFNEVLKSNVINIRYKKINGLIDFLIIYGIIQVIKEIFNLLKPYIVELDPSFEIDLLLELYFNKLNPVFHISCIINYIHSLIYYAEISQIEIQLLQFEKREKIIGYGNSIEKCVTDGNPVEQIVEEVSINYNIIESSCGSIIDNLLHIYNKINIGDYCKYYDFLIAIIDFI